MSTPVSRTDYYVIVVLSLNNRWGSNAGGGRDIDKRTKHRTDRNKRARDKNNK